MQAQGANADDLQKHISGTYFSLRLGMGLLAVALPLALWVGGWIGDGEGLRCSMSAYYFSPTMRDKFVGFLCAIGLFLYLYKGFSRQENWALNAAGAFAVLIALVPTSSDCEGDKGFGAHGLFAILFFIAIAYVAIFRAADTLSLIKDPQKAERMRNLYRVLGVLMVVSPLAAAILAESLQPGSPGSSRVFFIETFAVLTFAAYWLVKSRELSATDAEKLALERKLKQASPPPADVPHPPGKLVQIAADDVMRLDSAPMVGDRESTSR
jgi:hypothetical protein